MKVVVQRVKKASVTVSNQKVAQIGSGLLIFLGIETKDSEDDVDWLASKISELRIFNDNSGVMNLSIVDADGEIIVVSQFTLHAKTKKGNRPSYINAARPEIAIPLYERFINTLKSESNKEIQTGEFGEMMDVELINDGPVTIIIDSKNKE